MFFQNRRAGGAFACKYAPAVNSLDIVNSFVFCHIWLFRREQAPALQWVVAFIGAFRERPRYRRNKRYFGRSKPLPYHGISFSVGERLGAPVISTRSSTPPRETKPAWLRKLYRPFCTENSARLGREVPLYMPLFYHSFAHPSSPRPRNFPEIPPFSPKNAKIFANCLKFSKNSLLFNKNMLLYIVSKFVPRLLCGRIISRRIS